MDTGLLRGVGLQIFQKFKFPEILRKFLKIFGNSRSYIFHSNSLIFLGAVLKRVIFSEHNA